MARLFHVHDIIENLPPRTYSIAYPSITILPILSPHVNLLYLKKKKEI
jgi:hypothetical protein